MSNDLTEEELQEQHLLWLAEFDAWEALTDAERERRIKWELE